MDDKLSRVSKLGLVFLLVLNCHSISCNVCDDPDNEQCMPQHPDETGEAPGSDGSGNDAQKQPVNNIYMKEQSKTNFVQDINKPIESATNDQAVADDVQSDNRKNNADTERTAQGHDADQKTADSENGEQVTDDNDSVKETLNTTSSNFTKDANSTLLQWVKFILDPLLEEFKDGIYPNSSDRQTVVPVNFTNATQNDTAETQNLNTTVVDMINATEVESSNITSSSKKAKFQCVGRNVSDNVNATVKLITTAKLLQMLNFEKNSTENVTDCLLVMFYAPWCHFCAQTAPHYNALARAFPQLDFFAVDTAQFSNLLARFGTVSVPNILVFHQSKAAFKFNHTERTLEYFKEFVTNTTGLEANNTVNVTEADHVGPVPSIPTNEPDYLLMVSWAFVIFCSTCMFVKSTKGQQWINRVRILWQEHQHID